MGKSQLLIQMYRWVGWWGIVGGGKFQKQQKNKTKQNKTNKQQTKKCEVGENKVPKKTKIRGKKIGKGVGKK